MNLTRKLIRRGKRTTRHTSGLSQAARAAELNAAISKLWQDQGTHSQADFNEQVVPMYTALLEELRQQQAPDSAEQCLLDLLKQTAKACRHRWTVRLPMKRPGSDYRKYEIIYTEALVTAMAVGCLAAHADTRSPAQLATRIVPEEGMARLTADPLVWEDWRGYFEQADRGGLYAVSLCAKPVKHTQTTTGRKRPPTAQPPTPKPPPAGSGRAMLAAIRAAIADGSLAFNQPGDVVQVDREGRTFLAYPAILEWCKRQLALDEDLTRVKNRFNRLKVYKRSAEGKQLFRGRQGERDPITKGYVLEDASLLWQGPAPKGRFVIENVTGQR